VALRLLLVLEGIAVGMLSSAMFMAGIMLPPIYSIERSLSAMPGAALLGAPCGLICTLFLLRPGRHSA